VASVAKVTKHKITSFMGWRQSIAYKFVPLTESALRLWHVLPRSRSCRFWFPANQVRDLTPFRIPSQGVIRAVASADLRRSGAIDQSIGVCQ